MKEKIEKEFKKALKERNKRRISILRMLRAGLKNKEIEKRPGELEEEDILGVITKMVRQHKESIKEFKKGNREDLVEKEKEELKILKEFLPEQLSEEEVREKVKSTIEDVNATGMKDMGKVMGRLMSELKGKADGKLVNKIAKQELSKLK